MKIPRENWIRDGASYYADVSIGRAWIDAEDLPLISGMCWYKSGKGYLASNKAKKIIGGNGFMHRLIMGCSGAARLDHINGNPIDNRKGNLRLANASENGANRKPNRGKRTKGIWWASREKRWRVVLKKNYKAVFEAYCRTEEEAIRKYDEAIKLHFGEFARPNIIKERKAA